ALVQLADTCGCCRGCGRDPRVRRRIGTTARQIRLTPVRDTDARATGPALLPSPTRRNGDYGACVLPVRSPSGQRRIRAAPYTGLHIGGMMHMHAAVSASGEVWNGL